MGLQARCHPALESAQCLVFATDLSRKSCAIVLDLLRKRFGFDVAIWLRQIKFLTKSFQHDRIRTEIDSQQMADRMDLAMNAPRLIDVINLMENNIEVPLSLPAIAEKCKLSLRQIERLFHKYRGLTPSQYYLSLRLMHAKQLLLNTNSSVIDISIATGFETQSYFTACYRKHFGSSPRNHRSQVATERKA